MNGWAWITIYFVAFVGVPRKNLCRGLFTRHVLARVIPPRRWWRTGDRGLMNMWRYFVWLGLLEIPYRVRHLPDTVFNALFFGTYTLLLLDDYLFGDDDRWKRFKEWCGNKIKWQMELPPAPVPDEVV